MKSGHVGSDEAGLCNRFEHALHSSSITEAPAYGSERGFNADWIVRIGDTPFLLRTRSGHLESYCRGLPLMCSSDFSINGSVEAWAALWIRVPPAGWHDLLALAKRGEMHFEGNMRLFMAHLQYIKDFLALPRHQGPA